MTPLKSVIRWSRTPMVRFLRWAAYEARRRDASVEGLPASITYTGGRAMTCTCGCGESVNPGRRYVRGHNRIETFRNPADPVRFNKRSNRWVIYCRDGSHVYYYRAVMEAHLGRPLCPDEHVHHINGNPSDDRIENLELLTKGEHMSLHMTERHANRKEEARRAA